MENPKISVIIPVYNVAPYLQQCLDSVRQQTFSDFEAILVDDGSTDDSGSISDSYAENDSRFVVIHKSNAGAGEARNAGLGVSRGQYIAFIDADDLVAPEYLERLLEAAEKYPGTITACDFVKFKGPGAYNFDINNHIHEAGYYVLKPQKLLKSFFNNEFLCYVWGKLYNREIIGNTVFSNFAIGEDSEFNSRVYRKAPEGLVKIQTPLYAYRKRRGSLLSSPFSENNRQHLDSILRVVHNYSHDDAETRSFALKRLYKNLLSLRYAAPEPYRKEVNAFFNQVVAESKKEFYRNTYIKRGFKTAVFILIRFPSLYRLFRWWAERYYYKEKLPTAK